MDCSTKNRSAFKTSVSDLSFTFFITWKSRLPFPHAQLFVSVFRRLDRVWDSFQTVCGIYNGFVTGFVHLAQLTEFDVPAKDVSQLL